MLLFPFSLGSNDAFNGVNIQGIARGKNPAERELYCSGDLLARHLFCLEDHGCNLAPLRYAIETL